MTREDTIPRRTNDGFTLIELVVVIVILVALAAIAIPLFLNQKSKAAAAADRSSIKSAAQFIAQGIADGSISGSVGAGMASATGKMAAFGGAGFYDAATGAFCVSKGGFRASDATGGAVVADAMPCGSGSMPMPPPPTYTTPPPPPPTYTAPPPPPPTTTPDYDFAPTMVRSNAAPSAGDTFEYTVTVSNRAVTAAAGSLKVYFNGTYGMAFAPRTAQPGGGWTCDNPPDAQSVCIYDSAVANGATTPPLTVTVPVPADKQGVGANFSVSVVGSDADSMNNSAMDYFTVR